MAEAETKISSQSAECERLKTELQDEQEKTSYLMDEFKTVLKTLYPITWKDSPNKSVPEIEKWSFQNLKENLFEWRNDYSKDIKNTLTKRLEKRGMFFITQNGPLRWPIKMDHHRILIITTLF